MSSHLNWWFFIKYHPNVINRDGLFAGITCRVLLYFNNKKTLKYPIGYSCF